jgi:arylsulfatase A-like enzyme
MRLVLAGFLTVGFSGAGQAAELPNILLINVDDMGWGQPGCYGGKLVSTPNMDAIAANGIRFTDAYASGPVCTPSRVGLLTGRYQARTGHDALTVPSKPESQMLLSEVTIAQRLKPLGYTTGIVGKWHLGENPGYLPASRGFDYSIGSVANVSEGPNGRRYYRGMDLIPDPVEKFNTIPLYEKESILFMEENREKPWFLYLSVNNVHGPVTASQSYLDRFADETSNPRQKYMACITELDDVIGSIMNKLQELDLEKNTLVIFLSDNGKSNDLGEQGNLRGKKWTLWEGGIRTPLMIQWKGRIPENQVSHEPVIQLDLFPTILAAAGGTVLPEWQIDGVNLLPLMEGKTDKLEPRTLYWRYGPQYAIRQGDWKIVKAAIELNPMLINLAADESEQTDLSGEYPEKMQLLQNEWDRWNAEMQPPRWEDLRWNGDLYRSQMKPKKKAAPKKQPFQQ